MGRVLCDVRRQAAIDLWRERFNEIIAGQRVTMKVLAAVLGLDLTRLTTSHRDRLAEARRKLAGILTPAPGEPSALSLGAWFNQYLVERGPHLLVTPAARNAVLAAVRDHSRRPRNAHFSNSKVTLQVPIETKRRLRAFARKMNLSNDGEAIDALLAGQPTKPRRLQKTDLPQPTQTDLLI